MSSLSIIIPASNEAEYIQPCLQSLIDQDYQGQTQILVVANGCRDDTADRARSMATGFAARGWRLDVIEREAGGKIAALNHGDAKAVHGHRLYLDADVAPDRDMLSALMLALQPAAPRYAGGKLVVAPAQSAVSRAYGRFWSSLPFMTKNVTGAGLFAVNPAGRARWAQFPQLISDDTYVRLQFSEDERLLVASSYRWPLAEGFDRLVRVRRRQDHGVREIAEKHPELMARQGHVRPGRSELARLALRDPVGFAVYSSVALAVRLRSADGHWTRGR